MSVRTLRLGASCFQRQIDEKRTDRHLLDTTPMALPFAHDNTAAASDRAPSSELVSASRDPRALRILAKSIYRELRQGGLAEEDVMTIAGDLLGLIAGEVKDRRLAAESRR